jgi:two-component system chemotaxis response regulator CheB
MSRPDVLVRGAPPAVNPSSRPFRVLVVDDSAVQRAALIALLEADPGLEVVGWAIDGADAVRAVAGLRPDVVTMDARMPRMDGITATARIMHETPTPIVMVVTTSTTGDDARTAFEALQAGVLAIVRKPSGLLLGSSAGSVQTTREGRELVRTVKSMAQIKVVRHWSPERRQLVAAPPPLGGPPRSAAPAGAVGAVGAVGTPTAVPGRPLKLVVVGASTGGPQALGLLLPLLPADFPLPVLIVQHIAEGFVAGMVSWLTSCCALPVHLAVAGQALGPPGIFVAPTGRHLVVRNRTLWLSEEPPVAGHRPSVTALFQSAAQEYGAGAVGVLLSGMGEDGAAGLRDLKRAGAATVAQDEASSVVFGMPAAAIQMGVVDYVLPPAAIAPLLMQLAVRGAADLRLHASVSTGVQASPRDPSPRDPATH